MTRWIPIATAALLFATPLAAQTRQVSVPTLDAARAIADSGLAEARRQGWQVVIAVVDAAGDLLVLQRMDDVQPGSIEIAIGKARTAARFRRPTRALADALAQGRLGFLAVEGALPMEGGVPLQAAGRTIGGVGVSGMTGAQDAVVAEAGARALR